MINLNLSAFSLGIREELEKNARLAKQAKTCPGGICPPSPTPGGGGIATSQGMTGLGLPKTPPMTPMRQGNNPRPPVDFKNSVPRTGETMRLINSGKLKPLGDVPGDVVASSPSFGGTANTMNRPPAPMISPQQNIENIKRNAPEVLKNNSGYVPSQTNSTNPTAASSPKPISPGPTGRDLDSIESFREYKARQSQQPVQPAAGTQTSAGQANTYEQAKQQLVQANPALGQAGSAENKQFIADLQARYGPNYKEYLQQHPEKLTEYVNKYKSEAANNRDMAERGRAVGPAGVNEMAPEQLGVVSRKAEALRNALENGTLTPAQIKQTIQMMPANERSIAENVVAGGRAVDPYAAFPNQPGQAYTVAQQQDAARSTDPRYAQDRQKQNYIARQQELTSKYPDLKDPNSPLYKEFMKNYQETKKSMEGHPDYYGKNHERLLDDAWRQTVVNSGENPNLKNYTSAFEQNNESADVTGRTNQHALSSGETITRTDPQSGHIYTTTSKGTVDENGNPYMKRTNAQPEGAPATDPEIQIGPYKAGSVDISGMPINENILPKIDRQARWKYVRTKDGLRLTDGNLVYSFGGFPDSYPAEDTRISRMADDNILNFENDAISKGTAQIHRSSPDNIYMTLATGRDNPTFMLQHEEGKNWRYTPSKKFLAKLKALSEMSKKENPALPEQLSVDPQAMLDAAADTPAKMAFDLSDLGYHSQGMTSEDLSEAAGNIYGAVKNFGKNFLETHSQKPITGFAESYLASKGISKALDMLNPKRQLKRLVDPKYRRSREISPLVEAALSTLGSRAIMM